MSKLVQWDNPVWAFLGKLTDLAILTVLWTACCLPLVTAGAATAALYDLAFQIARNQERYIIPSFFRAFGKHLRRGTAVWLGSVCTGAFLASDLYLYSRMDSRAGVVLLASAGTLGILFLMTFVYLFPFTVLCDGGLKHLCAMAFVTALRNPGWTVLMLVSAGGIAAAGIFAMAPLLIISAGLTAYIHAKIIIYILWNCSGQQQTGLRPAALNRGNKNHASEDKENEEDAISKNEQRTNAG